MNAFIHLVQPEKPVLIHEAKMLLPLVTEFSEESRFNYEDECQGWGIEDVIFPAECWDKFFDIIKEDKDIKKSIDRGFVHIVNIQEKADGNDENSVVLAAGFLGIQQKLIFQS